MLFEIFLVIGITLLPISFGCLALGCGFDGNTLFKTGLAMFVIGVMSLVLCFALPPIPIIPQGG